MKYYCNELNEGIGRIGNPNLEKPTNSESFRIRDPDMARMVNSKKQKSCRRLFKETSAYAVSILVDHAKKEALALRIGKNTGLYNAAIKQYLLSVRSPANIKPVREYSRL